MATGSVSPKTGKILNIPDQTVTIGTATDGGTGTSVSVPFTIGSVATGGPVNYFTATSTPGSFTANASTSPVTVSGLTTGTAYTFKVKAGNPTGYSTAGESAASNSVTPALPGAFESIATTTGTGSSGVITFSSIPSTYKHLQVRILGRTTAAQTTTSLNVRYNSSTSGYANHSFQGNGSITEIKTDVSGAEMIIYQSLTGASAASSVMGTVIMDIPDYASTTKNKTFRSLSGQNRPAQSQGGIWLSSGFLNDTAAIDSLTFTVSSGNWTTDSTISLYGIKG